MSENNNALETRKEPETPAGHIVVGIRFRPCGKIYTFKVDDIDAAPGTKVVVESEMGLSLGSVAVPKHTIEKSREPLKKVLRVASEKDFETVKNNRSLEDEAKAFCIEKSKEYNLQMKIVTTETTLDKKRLIFYFTADGRIDFRELVRDLAAKFRTRIEMRQIGVRDEVKMLGGIGVCGRQTCCSQFLTFFEPITIRMAKEQELSINQSKLSGICGRLMCCLGYEYRDTDEKAATSMQDKAPVTEKLPDNNLRHTDTDKIPVQSQSRGPDTADKQNKHAERSSNRNIIQGKNGVSAAVQPEKSVEKERPLRRKRRRRRGSSAKPSDERPPQEKSEPAGKSHEGEPQQNERKDQNKPFSKRRKFWKKKKH